MNCVQTQRTLSRALNGSNELAIKILFNVENGNCKCGLAINEHPMGESKKEKAVTCDGSSSEEEINGNYVTINFFFFLKTYI